MKINEYTSGAGDHLQLKKSVQRLLLCIAGAFLPLFAQSQVISNGDFSDYYNVLRAADADFSVSGGANFFTAGTNYALPNTIPTNARRVAVQTGTRSYNFGSTSNDVNQVAFPGDPNYFIPATSNWLLHHGAVTNASITFWRKTAIPVVPGATYRFWAYTSNAVETTDVTDNDPIIGFYIDPGTGYVLEDGLFTIYDDNQPESGHNGADLWDRREITYTVPAGVDTIAIELRSSPLGNTSANGKKLAITQINGSQVPVANNVTHSTSFSAGSGATQLDALSGSDPDGTISGYTLVTLPAGGTLYVNGVAAIAGQIITAAEAAQLTFDPSGSITSNTTFTFQANDGFGLTSANTATYTIPLIGFTLSGIVFDDVNYGGGAGRNYATANTAATASGFGNNAIARPGARVELFSATGTYLTFTTTATDGTYSFTNLSANTSYTVRVVSNSVTSMRGTSTNLLPVPTYVNGNVNRVGGETPSLVDANNGSTTLANLNTATTVAQVISSVPIGTANAANVDFGFNFNVIVNTRDAGQGSLRQFVLNANLLPNTNLAQENQPAGREVSIFMIPDGNAHPGLRAGLANALSVNGIAEITLTSTFLTIVGGNGGNTTIDGSTQTTFVGNTNIGTFGISGTVGVDAIAIPSFQRPEIEIAASGLATAISIQRPNTYIRNLAVRGGTTQTILVSTGGSGYLVENTLIGTSASSFTFPNNATSSGGFGINVTSGAGTGIIQYCMMGFTGNSGVRLNNGSTAFATTIQGNQFQQNGYTSAGGDGVSIGDAAQNGPVSITGNLFTRPNSSAVQFEIGFTAASTVTNNTIVDAGEGGASVSFLEGSAICYLQRNGTNTDADADVISKNVISSSQYSAIVVGYGRRNVTISQNSFFNNGNLSIDLVQVNNAVSTPAPNNLVYGNGNGVTGNNGTLEAVSSLIANRGIDYPVITAANASSTTLQVSGYVGSATGQTAFSGARIEVYAAINDANNNGNIVDGDGLSVAHGELETYIGALTAGADGSFSGTLTLPAGVTLTTNSLISATATITSAGTSEPGPNADVNMVPVAASIVHAPSIPNTAVPRLLTALSATDSDGIVASYTIQTLPLASQGSLLLNGVAVTAGQVLTIAQAAQLSFDPVNTYSGTATFTYQATDNNGGTSLSTLYFVPVSADAASVYTVADPEYFFFLNLNNTRASVTDPNGAITAAALTSGTLPPGVTLNATTGLISVSNINLLVGGTYPLQLRTTDALGGQTVNAINLVILSDWDTDGIAEGTDRDDNNDGIADLTVDNNANPFADHDNDGTRNYMDPQFAHPSGAFADTNGDGINDRFDTDLDGVLNTLDIDLDNDGITNAIEVNNGVAGPGYSSLRGMFTGPVGANGMIDAFETGTESNLYSFTNINIDGDALPDYLDLDSDSDGITDNLEAQDSGSFATRTGLDADADGLDDAFDATCGCAVNGTAILPLNTDGLEEPDYLSQDADGDLMPDYSEGFDTDGDGIAIDDLRNRMEAFAIAAGNAGLYPTTDSNANGVEDVFQDHDNDGIKNYLDPQSTYYHDTNGNGLIDLFDPANFGVAAALPDQDSNGTPDFRDAGTMTPLPVELIWYTAKRKADAALLEWETASEENNAGYQLEVSSDNRKFQNLAFVTASLSGSQGAQYAYSDEGASRFGTRYYRLTQFDLDGTKTVLGVRTVTFDAGTTTLTVGPNPFNQAFTATLVSDRTQEGIFTLTDALGREVSRQVIKLEKGTNAVPFANQNLNNGLYILGVQLESEVLSTRITRF